MLFYTDSEYYSLLEHMGCIFLEPVHVKIHGAGWLKKARWATGWIIEGDDCFDVYCTMMHGFSPAKITEEEYYELDANGIVFFSKTRGKEVKDRVWQLRKRLNKG